MVESRVRDSGYQIVKNSYNSETLVTSNPHSNRHLNYETTRSHVNRVVGGGAARKFDARLPTIQATFFHDLASDLLAAQHPGRHYIKFE